MSPTRLRRRWGSRIRWPRGWYRTKRQAQALQRRYFVQLTESVEEALELQRARGRKLN